MPDRLNQWSACFWIVISWLPLLNHPASPLAYIQRYIWGPSIPPLRDSVHISNGLLRLCPLELLEAMGEHFMQLPLPLLILLLDGFNLTLDVHDVDRRASLFLYWFGSDR